MDVPVLQISSNVVEEFNIVPQEQTTERICEPVVDVLVPHVDVLEALQFHVCAISHEIQEKCSGVDSDKEVFFDKDT